MDGYLGRPTDILMVSHWVDWTDSWTVDLKADQRAYPTDAYWVVQLVYMMDGN